MTVEFLIFLAKLAKTVSIYDILWIILSQNKTTAYLLHEDF